MTKIWISLMIAILCYLFYTADQNDSVTAAKNQIEKKRMESLHGNIPIAYTNVRYIRDQNGICYALYGQGFTSVDCNKLKVTE